MTEPLPDVAFTLSQWLQVVALGGLSGLAGQVIRVVAGLKKASDEAAAKQETLSDVFNGGRLVLSLAIGAVAGFLALLTQVDATGVINVSTILALMAAGYAGTDFVEAFAARYLPNGKVAPAKVPAAGDPPQSNTSDSNGAVGQPPATDDSVG